MRFPALLIFALALLFLNFDCGEDNYFAISLPLEMVAPEIVLITSDTVWLRADFGADIVGGSGISDNGGLGVLYIFQVDSSTNELTEAVSNSQFFIANGEPFTTPDELDEAGLYFRYCCPDRRCQFEVGWQPQEPGLYMVVPEGLGYEASTISSPERGEQNYFDGAWVQNAPTYFEDYPWLVNRNFDYNPSSGFPRRYTIFEGSSVLFFEVRP